MATQLKVFQSSLRSKKLNPQPKLKESQPTLTLRDSDWRMMATLIKFPKVWSARPLPDRYKPIYAGCWSRRRFNQS